LNKNPLAFATLVFLLTLFTCLTVSSVWAQQPNTTITVNPDSGVVGTQVNVQGIISTANGSYSISFEETLVGGTSDEYSVNETFAVPSLTAGNYNITLQDTTSNQTATATFTITTSVFSFLPALSIMGVSFGLALLNSGLNRILISRFVGWNDYQTMQKETKEWRSQQMAAARANDKKQLEKLKKKESQMMNMQKKMVKPQMLLLGFTLVYFLIWPVLTGFFPGNIIYIPGFGPQPFFIWYLLCSLFLGTVVQRILGIMPLE